MSTKKTYPCEICSRQFDMRNVRTFNVPIQVCAITHAMTVGHRIVFVCRECENEKGIPVSEYSGVIRFSNDTVLEKLK